MYFYILGDSSELHLSTLDIEDIKASIDTKKFLSLN